MKSLYIISLLYIMIAPFSGAINSRHHTTSARNQNKKTLDKLKSSGLPQYHRQQHNNNNNNNKHSRIVSSSISAISNSNQLQNGKPYQTNNNLAPAQLKAADSNCYFGSDSYSVGDKWNPNLPPFGIQSCVICTCVPIQKKSCYEAKVKCKNIKNDCPQLDKCSNGDMPVIKPGNCCKSCPGEQQGENRPYTSSEVSKLPLANLPASSSSFKYVITDNTTFYNNNYNNKSNNINDAQRETKANTTTTTQIVLSNKPFDLAGQKQRKEIPVEFQTILSLPVCMVQNDIPQSNSKKDQANSRLKPSKDLTRSLGGSVHGDSIDDPSAQRDTNDNTLQENGTDQSTDDKCLYEGKTYEDGTQWKAIHSNCTMCWCKTNRILCEHFVCPPLVCENNAPTVVIEGECCPLCQTKKSNNPKPRRPNGILRAKPSLITSNNRPVNNSGTNSQVRTRNPNNKHNINRNRQPLINLNATATTNLPNIIEPVRPKSSTPKVAIGSTDSPVAPNATIGIDSAQDDSEGAIQQPAGCQFESDGVFRLPGSKWHPFLPPLGWDRCSVCECLAANLTIRCSRSECPRLDCSKREAYRENSTDCCKRCPTKPQPSSTIEILRWR